MPQTKYMNRNRTAPELFGNFWFNSEPISLRSLQGSVVVLFFWDQTSTRSLRDIKHMNRLHENYSSCGLSVIGVQVAEYVEIRDLTEKANIIRSCGIVFPVVADDAHAIADSYRISDVPTVCLIAPKGDIYDLQSTRGALSRIERSIQYLLRQSGYFGELPYIENIDDLESEYPSAAVTPDFDFGYLHGSLGNSEGYNPELPGEYYDPFLYVEGKFYAHGVWIASKNSFEFAGERTDGYILFRYTGNDVDIVAGNGTSTDIVNVLVDDQPVDYSIRGSDIMIEASGATYLKINALMLAHIIHSRAIGTHTVKLIPSKIGTAFFRVSLTPFEDSLVQVGESESRPFHVN